MRRSIESRGIEEYPEEKRPGGEYGEEYEKEDLGFKIKEDEQGFFQKFTKLPSKARNIVIGFMMATSLACGEVALAAEKVEERKETKTKTEEKIFEEEKIQAEPTEISEAEEKEEVRKAYFEQVRKDFERSLEDYELFKEYYAFDMAGKASKGMRKHILDWQIKNVEKGFRPSKVKTIIGGQIQFFCSDKDKIERYISYTTYPISPREALEYNCEFLLRKAYGVEEKIEKGEPVSSQTMREIEREKRRIEGSTRDILRLMNIYRSLLNKEGKDHPEVEYLRAVIVNKVENIKKKVGEGAFREDFLKEYEKMFSE